jgi:hypothetical protein
VIEPHPLNPPLLIKERGNGYVREASPLFDSPYSGVVIRSFRGGKLTRARLNIIIIKI